MHYYAAPSGPGLVHYATYGPQAVLYYVDLVNEVFHKGRSLEPEGLSHLAEAAAAIGQASLALHLRRASCAYAQGKVPDAIDRLEQRVCGIRDQVASYLDTPGY